MGMNFKEVRKFLPMIFKTNLRPCLLGHTGIGKTECVTQFAQEHGLDLIIIHVAQLEPSDFVGLYKVNEDGRTDNCAPAWLPYKEEVTETSKVVKAKANTPEQFASVLKKAHSGIINPKGGIIFLDEVNRAHEDMRQALYQFLQTGELHTYSLPKGHPTEVNELGLPMGKYHIVCAANPSSEGYETYEFDPALMNRLAWVNFTPSRDETRSYLESKYGKNPVVSWLDSNKDIINLGEDFSITGLIYSPRMAENHIKLQNACRKENKEFKRKVFETIMPKEIVVAFMAYLEEIEYVNFEDVLTGVKGDKAKKLAQLVKDNRVDVLSTITNDLSEFWGTQVEAKATKKPTSKIFKDDKEEENGIKNTVDFLASVKDEQKLAFLDGLKDSFNLPTSIHHNDYFAQNFKEYIKKYRTVLKASK